jgi:hypothetical protein
MTKTTFLGIQEGECFCHGVSYGNENSDYLIIETYLHQMSCCKNTTIVSFAPPLVGLLACRSYRVPTNLLLLTP